MIDVEKIRKRLENRWPVVGKLIRRKACAEMAAEVSAQTVPLLAGAIADDDSLVRETALSALRSLRSQDAIDSLCALWAKERAAALGALIAERRYVASKPADLRVLSALKAGKPELAGDNAAAVAPLVAALRDRDSVLSQAAQTALRGLRNQDAIDALCALWAKERAAALGALIAETGYVAAKPADLRVLSALQTKQAGLVCQDGEFIVLVCAAMGDREPFIAGAAQAALGTLTKRDAVDALCRLAIQEPAGAAAKVCVETGKRPSDPEQAAIFLFVTRQLDAYFQEDFEFQNLRAAYDRAEERVQGHVMEVVRSGDRRCLGFFGRRKPLSECTQQEIELAVESGLKHRDWPRLFRAFQEMPLKYGFPLLAEFRKSGWEPEAADLKSVYRGALKESEGQELVAEAPKATSSLFERWLAEGRSGELGRLGESELLRRLETAAPPDGVRIVGALAAKGAAAGGVVQKNAHWLVRLAGYATGLCQMEIGQDVVSDSNYWVRELASGGKALELWPVKGTPADLEALNAAPAEAFVGKMGAVRRVLRLLLAYRVTVPDMEEVVYLAGEFAGEFEAAD